MTGIPRKAKAVKALPDWMALRGYDEGALALRAGIEERRVGELLDGAKATPEERLVLANVFGVSSLDTLERAPFEEYLPRLDRRFRPAVFQVHIEDASGDGHDNYLY